MRFSHDPSRFADPDVEIGVEEAMKAEDDAKIATLPTREERVAARFAARQARQAAWDRYIRDWWPRSARIELSPIEEDLWALAGLCGLIAVPLLPSLFIWAIWGLLRP